MLAPLALPMAGGGGRAPVLQVQVLLDAAGFSPGMLDGEWGENTRFALRAFREAHDLSDGTDVVDEETHALLRRLASGRPAVTTYPLSAADVRGPYRPVPSGVAAKAQAECLCYESLLERLSERFHARPALLRALNPDVDFSTAKAGTRITVPNTWRLPPRRPVARVFVTKDEGAVRGVDAAGTTVFWMPATVGSADMPSPQGALSVESVTRNPYYRWDPAVLKDVSRRAPVRMLPPDPTRSSDWCGWRCRARTSGSTARPTPRRSATRRRTAACG
jgi:peptidoglycan hydrolase-like protein with peptidoglycan-binding domain